MAGNDGDPGFTVRSAWFFPSPPVGALPDDGVRKAFEFAYDEVQRGDLMDQHPRRMRYVTTSAVRRFPRARSNSYDIRG